MFVRFSFDISPTILGISHITYLYQWSMMSNGLVKLSVVNNRFIVVRPE